MKYDQIEDFSDEQFRSLVGGVEAMSLEKCNTKTQRYDDTKSEDEISHQIIGTSIEVHRTLGGPGLSTLRKRWCFTNHKWHPLAFLRALESSCLCV